MCALAVGQWIQFVPIDLSTMNRNPHKFGEEQVFFVFAETYFPGLSGKLDGNKIISVLEPKISDYRYSNRDDHLMMGGYEVYGVSFDEVQKNHGYSKLKEMLEKIIEFKRGNRSYFESFVRATVSSERLMREWQVLSVS